MSNEYKDWQAEEIKELEAKVKADRKRLDVAGGTINRQADQIERLEKAARIADQKARQAGKARITEELRAALEGKQEKERCPHLAGDLCIKEGACECYGVEQDG